MKKYHNDKKNVTATLRIDRTCDRLEGGWSRASRRRQTWIYVGIYTIVFLIAALAVFSPLLLRGKSFVGGSDGHYQAWPALIYVGKWWRELFRNILHGSFEPKLFDISVGMGADVIGTLNWHGFGDPLYLLSVVVPTAYTEPLYIAVSVLFLYFAGLSFSYLCRYFNKEWQYALIGSLVYCFCGYATQSAGDWLYFCRPMIYLPLMIVGADKILQGRRPYLFILAVFGASLGGFYFMYMMTLLTGLYILIRFFSVCREKRLRAFFRMAVQMAFGYLLGIGLAALIFLPACLAYFESGRSGGNPVVSPTFLYSSQWYKTVLAVLFAPFNAFDEWNYQSYAVIALFAVLLLLSGRGKKTLKVMVLAAFAIYLTALGGKVMNGFAYPSNRWTFGLALLLAYVVAEELPELLTLSGRGLKICLAAGLVCAALLLALKTTGDTRNVWLGAVFMLATLVVLVLAHPQVQDGLLWVRAHTPAFKRAFASTLCLLLVLFNVGLYGTYELDGDRSEFAEKYPFIGTYSNNLSNHMVKNAQPYLYGNPEGRVDFPAKSSFRNVGMLFQVPMIPYYWSVTNQNVTNFWESMENPGLQTSINLYNSDWRTITSSILSVKYFVSDKKSLGKLPYGYSAVEENDGVFVYENNYALPWGYTYEETISYDELDALNGLEKQEAMLQAVALEEPGTFGEALLDFNEQPISYEMESDGCTWEDGMLTVSEANAAITLRFEMPAEAEGFVRLSGFRSSKSFNLSVASGKVTKFAGIQSPSALRYYEHENYLINLGYSDKSRTELTITFPAEGTFQLDDIELYALPMDNYPERVEALRAEPLENIQWGT